jgi:hypothetical protein
MTIDCVIVRVFDVVQLTRHEGVEQQLELLHQLLKSGVLPEEGTPPGVMI